MTTTYRQYAWGSAQEAMRHTGENYERYFVPAIGTPSARPVVDAASIRPGERVLDVGCGTGAAARLAADEAGPTGTVIGVDPTPPMLAAARTTSSEVEWLEGDAGALPPGDESVDVVIASLSFQFFADKATALREMRRVMVPGGRLAIGTVGPIPPLMAALADALEEHIGPEASKFVRAVFSVHDPDQVRAMIDEAGFEDITIEVAPVPLHVPRPADFFWQYVHCTPLAGITTELDDATRTALERDVVARCQPFLEGDGMAMEPDVLVATARRP